MKICIVGLRGLPRVAGGVETHCEQLFPRLKALRPGDDFVLVGRKAYCPGGAYQGLTVVPLYSARSRYLEAISNAIAGVFYARFVHRSDVVHIHAIGPSLVAPLVKLLGMRLVVTHHGADYNRAKWNGVARTALRWGERNALRFADHVIAVSPSLRDHLGQGFPRRRSAISYVPNGANHLDAGSAAPDLLQRLGLEEQKFIVSVGRLVPEKGFHELIAAHRAAATDMKLVIVGGASPDDPYHRHLRQLAGDGVILTGSLDRADLALLLRRTALFVLASHHEGLPIAALEAASAGAPVLLSDIQPNKDLGFPDSHYFPTGNIEVLSERLKQDPESFRLPQDGHFHQFDWDKVAEQTSLIYAALDTGSRTAPLWARGLASRQTR